MTAPHLHIRGAVSSTAQAVHLCTDFPAMTTTPWLLLPHQKWIHPCPPPQRPHLPLKSGWAWEHESASSVACSPSIQPAGANTQAHESHANVNIVCYPIRKIKHVNLCLIAPRSAVWTFGDLSSIRQMEHWDTLKSLYSPQIGGWKISEPCRSVSERSHFTKALEFDSSFFLLCQSLGDSLTIRSMREDLSQNLCEQRTACFDKY